MGGGGGAQDEARMQVAVHGPDFGFGGVGRCGGDYVGGGGNKGAQVGEGVGLGGGHG